MPPWFTKNQVMGSYGCAIALRSQLPKVRLLHRRGETEQEFGNVNAPLEGDRFNKYEHLTTQLMGLF